MGAAHDRRPELIGASITLLILPTLAVALRFMSRLVARAGFWVVLVANSP